ncbi:MAG: hypothetical protein R3C30_07875 [Hyphomonadaceae bacterium]
MSRSPVRLLLVSMLGVVSLVALWLAFELRYIWYLDEPTALAMRGGFALAALGILVCWFVAPSRLLVGVLGLAALLFPLVVGLSDVPINLGFLQFAGFVVGLLVVTTHLRRRML